MGYRCAFCGKPHDEDDPPCDECGHDTLVPVDAAGEDAYEVPVWICTDCGCEHPKYSPPCSRCGEMSIERRSRVVGDDAGVTVGTIRYRDLVTPRYLAGLAVALLLGAVLVLGVAGVVDLPGVGNDVPAVADVPGNATATAEGFSLAAVERAYLDAYREGAGGNATVESNDRLAAVARFYNQRRVRSEYADGSLPEDSRLRELIGDTCPGRVTLVAFDVAPGEVETGGNRTVESAAALGRGLHGTYLARGGSFPEVDRGLAGVDVHAAPDGTLYVAHLLC